MLNTDCGHESEFSEDDLPIQPARVSNVLSAMSSTFTVKVPRRFKTPEQKIEGNRHQPILLQVDLSKPLGDVSLSSESCLTPTQSGPAISVHQKAYNTDRRKKSNMNVLSPNSSRERHLVRSQTILAEQDPLQSVHRIDTKKRLASHASLDSHYASIVHEIQDMKNQITELKLHNLTLTKRLENNNSFSCTS